MSTISGAFVDLKNLLPGSVLDVETRSRHYLIECLGGNAIRISGHPDFCPNPVPAQLQGAITRDGAVEFGLIEPGMKFLFVLNGNIPVTTSRVVRVRLNKPNASAAQGSSSFSIH